MSKSYLIKNARIVNEGSVVEGDVLIEAGRIAKIDSSTGKVNKREDGKVLKPEGWKPPELEKFLGE